MEKRIEKIEEEIRIIRENHLEHIEIDLAKVTTDVGWLMKFFWIVATSSIGGLITGVLNLIK